MSHLLQMRGLKLQLFFNLKHLSNVASFTDAWIETLVLVLKNVKKLSHLLQMRGLKLAVMYGNLLGTRSHLLQMRGLKL